MSFAAFLSMAVELADCTRPVSFVAGSTFAFFGLATLFGGGAAVAKFLAAPARRCHTRRACTAQRGWSRAVGRARLGMRGGARTWAC